MLWYLKISSLIIYQVIPKISRLEAIAALLEKKGDTTPLWSWWDVGVERHAVEIR